MQKCFSVSAMKTSAGHTAVEVSEFHRCGYYLFVLYWRQTVRGEVEAQVVKAIHGCKWLRAEKYKSSTCFSGPGFSDGLRWDQWHFWVVRMNKTAHPRSAEKHQRIEGAQKICQGLIGNTAYYFLISIVLNHLGCFFLKKKMGLEIYKLQMKPSLWCLIMAILLHLQMAECIWQKVKKKY